MDKHEESVQLPASVGSGRRYKTPRLERFGEISHVTQGSGNKGKDADGEVGTKK
ncbi:hypothetical protein [Candidatus Seongchinamella marina]|uniref:hypothetical protein n=1 Tax=Candidatus Seongchinamella marina TaxID=2518990 RepID=UPI00242A9F03|nr:hypothetical protein [Candidatus Seongchinamella marina]